MNNKDYKKSILERKQAILSNPSNNETHQLCYVRNNIA